MRTMSLRALHREPPTDETVLVTLEGQIVGTYIPVGLEPVSAGPIAVRPVTPETNPNPIGRMSQAERDRVLRKVGK